MKTDIDGRQTVQLASGNAQRPRVTPDGRSVVFGSSRSGVQSPWIVSIDGGEPTQVVNEFASGSQLDVTSDGRLVFVGTGQRFIVCSLPACGDRKTVTASPLVARSHVAWAPDGRGVAYVSAGTESDIWVQPVAGGPARQFTHFSSDRTITDFAWSADGKRLAVVRQTTKNDIVLFKGLTGR